MRDGSSALHDAHGSRAGQILSHGLALRAPPERRRFCPGIPTPVATSNYAPCGGQFCGYVGGYIAIRCSFACRSSDSLASAEPSGHAINVRAIVRAVRSSCLRHEDQRVPVIPWLLHKQATDFLTTVEQHRHDCLAGGAFAARNGENTQGIKPPVKRLAV